MPRRRLGWARGVVTAGLLVGTTVALGADPKPPKVSVRLTLESLGVPVASANFLEAGASMLSVHFVDADHLLVTYSMRGLVERIVGDPPEDDDRAVAGLLVELPSGKVLARTRWHLHDHAQYVWGLGGGRFLLRNRSTLTAFAPMANLASGEAFRQMSFLHARGPITGLQVSPEGDLVTVEAAVEPVGVAETTAAVMEGGRMPPRVQEVEFVRVQGTGAAGSPVIAMSAGMLRTLHAGLLPLNGRGYLVAKNGVRGVWAVEYNGFDGTTKTLEYVNSSCAPRLQFVSPSQYVTFSCRGSDDKIMVSAFDFAPQEMWEELLGGSTTFPYFAFGQISGRFAMSRTVALTAGTMPGTQTSAGTGGTGLSQDALTGQEVRVYQTQSGDLLLKLNSTPVLRTGQNFDLSTDGVSLLVVRNGAIEVYRLPPMNSRDKKELAEAQRFEPAMSTESRVEIRRMMKQAAVEAVEKDPVVAPVTPAAPPAVPAPVAVAAKPEPAASKAVPTQTAPAKADAVVQNGDQPTERRKPPSLLNPGESTEGAKPK